MMDASRRPSVILGRLTSTSSERVPNICMFFWLSSLKNIGVSQWLSRMTDVRCMCFACEYVFASLVSHWKMGIMLWSAARVKHSGCHWRPSSALCWLLSMASMMPSGLVAEMRRWGPASHTAWWWKELTGSFSVLKICASLLPGAMFTVWVAICLSVC